MKRALFVSATLAAVACGAPAPKTPPPGPLPSSGEGVRGEVSKPAPAGVFDCDFLRAYSETRRFTRGEPRGADVTPDGKTALFLRSGARDPKQSLFATDLATGTTREILTPDAVLAGPEHLTAEERALRERLRITSSGFTSFEISEDGASVVVVLSGRLFVLDRASGKTRELKTKGAIDPHLSPDGKSVAFVASDDVHVVPTAGGAERAITTKGTELVPHGLADFIAAEELARYRGFWWSPDSRDLLVEEWDGTKLETFTIADPAHPEDAGQRVPYPRAGKNNATLRFAIVPAAGGAPRWVEWDREAFPYVATVTWNKGGPPTLTVLDRAQKVERLLAIDRATGKTRLLVEEKDEAWVNVDPSVPRWLPDGSGFLWSSEREGAWRLELHASDGKPVRALTPMDAGYTELAHVDGKRKVAYVNAAADAVHGVVLRVPLDGGAIATLAKVDGGDATMLDRDADDPALVDESSLTAPPRTVVRPVDGARRALELPSLAEKPPLPTVSLEEVGPDKMHVAIVRPRSFVAGARYAVVDDAYAGPHANVVKADAQHYLRAQWLADATSAIVVAIDARGTPGRGRAWERAIAGKLGTVPLEGHVEAIRALAAAHPEMDLSRVGVFGWSFGGYFSATAVLRRPDVYTAGVAIAPVADWRDYDTAYSERYLGHPDKNAAAYDEASVLTWAAKPGPAKPPALTIVHGTADDNVYFLNSLRLADALERAGRPFAFVPAVGQTHQIASTDLFYVALARAAETLRDGLAPPR